jgi:hypothetical protein
MVLPTAFVQTRTLVTFATISSILALGVISLLAVTDTIYNSSDNQFLREVSANHMNLINSTEKSIVHQGLIASEKPIQIHTAPNESIQVVTILPFRNDGSIYKGDLTYTATKPVEITIGHKIPLNDSTLAKLETEKHGKLYVRHLAANVEGNLSAPSKIIPEYRASAAPYYSDSIHFVGSQVVLRSNEPFIVAYTVAADIVKPTIIIHLENATVG